MNSPDCRCESCRYSALCTEVDAANATIAAVRALCDRADDDTNNPAHGLLSTARVRAVLDAAPDVDRVRDEAWREGAAAGRSVRTRTPRADGTERGGP